MVNSGNGSNHVMGVSAELGTQIYNPERSVSSKDIINFDQIWQLKDIDGIFLSLHIKNGLFCNREQPNLFIQRSSLNIMYMLRHKMLGCSSVYDEDFLRRDESGGLWGGNGQNLDESGGFGGKMDEWTKFGFFCRAILNAGIYSCERY